MATKFLRRKAKRDPSGEVVAVDTAATGGQAEYDRLTDTSKARSRGHVWVDVTPEGGGSSFAHLTEDAGAEAVKTDWQFLAGPGDQSGPESWISPGKIDLYQDALTDQVLSVGIVGDPGHAYSTLEAYADGSLHWGDGATAPSAHFGYSDDPNILALLLTETGKADKGIAFYGDGIYAIDALDWSGAFAGVNTDGSHSACVANDASVAFRVTRPGDSNARLDIRGQADILFGGGENSLDGSLKRSAIWDDGTLLVMPWLICGDESGDGYASIGPSEVSSINDVAGTGARLYADGHIFMTEYFEGRETTDPTAPAANNGRLYFKDVGGKTALMARFPSGSPVQVAIEP